MKKSAGTLILILFLVGSLLLALPGCGAETTPAAGTAAVPATPSSSSQPQVKSPTRLDSYTIADSTGDWGYPSPYAHYSRGPGYIRTQFIFETLVWKDATQFIPQLAREWEYNTGDKSYTFKLQENVKWHDGTDFTADDVVFTFQYAEEHPYQWVDNSIVESVEAVDRYTVKLYLSKTYAPFLQDVAGVQPILPKHIWQDVTEPEKFLGPEAVIGTGPYLYGDYSKEHGTYLFKANDSYYPGTPAVKEIKFVKIAAEMNPAALKGGTVDSASIQAEVVKDIEKAGFTVLTDNPSWNGKLTINHKKEPLSSVPFRQALAYAIDRQALAQIVFRGNAIAGSPGMLPPTSVWFNPETPQFEYNLDKAKLLLEGMGYRLQDGYYAKDGKVLKLSLIAAADYKDLGQFITQQLEKAGIDIEFQTLEGKTVDSKVGAWDFDLSIYGHGGIFEPSILQRCITGEGFNSARYKANDELTKLLTDQLTEMDTRKRKDMVFRIQKLYAEDMPALTLYYPISYWAHDGSLDLFYTMDGVATGVPIPINRIAFVKQESKHEPG